MSNERLRGALRLCGLVLIALGIRSVLLSVDDAALKPLLWRFDGTEVAKGGLIVSAAYALLIWSTGEIIRGWEIRVTALTTLRLWLRSNLARYVPRWSGLPTRWIAIAEEEGVPQKYIVGSALHPPLVWFGTAAAMAAVLLGLYRYGNSRLYLPFILIGGLAIFVSIFALAGTDVPRRIGLEVGRPEMMRPADAEHLGLAIAANVLAWTAAGYGLTLLGQGVLENFRADWMLVTGALAAATVFGYATLLLPTGLLVRELVLYALLKRELGAGPALAFALTCRGVLTMIEMLLSAFLLLRRPSRDAA